MKIIFKTKNSFLCTPIDIVKLFLRLASFLRNATWFWMLIWCGTLRLARLVSYAFSYTTSKSLENREEQYFA